MKDFFGHEIERNDHVAVLYAGQTTSCMVHGLVLSVTEKSCKYKVLKHGYQAYYGRNAEQGATKTCMTSDKIIDLEYDRPWE